MYAGIIHAGMPSVYGISAFFLYFRTNFHSSVISTKTKRVQQSMHKKGEKS